MCIRRSTSPRYGGLVWLEISVGMAVREIAMPRRQAKIIATELLLLLLLSDIFGI